MQGQNNMFLEIFFNKRRSAEIFPLTNVGNNHYMLTTRNDTVTLYDTLSQWVNQFLFQNEKNYTKMLDLRAGRIHEQSQHISSIHMDSLISFNTSFNNPNQSNYYSQTKNTFEYLIDNNNNENTIMIDSKLNLSDNQFISDKGKLVQWSIKHEKVIKNFAQIGNRCFPLRLALTHDKNILFGGNEQKLQKYAIKDETPIKEYSISDTWINSIDITKDDKFVFVGDSVEKYIQFCIAIYLLGFC